MITAKYTSKSSNGVGGGADAYLRTNPSQGMGRFWEMKYGDVWAQTSHKRSVKKVSGNMLLWQCWILPPISPNVMPYYRPTGFELYEGSPRKISRIFKWGELALIYGWTSFGMEGWNVVHVCAPTEHKRSVKKGNENMFQSEGWTSRQPSPSLLPCYVSLKPQWGRRKR